MYLLTAILIIVCIYFYRKSKNTKAKTPTIAISENDPYPPEKKYAKFSKFREDSTYLRVTINGEYGIFIHRDSPNGKYRIVWSMSSSSGYEKNGIGEVYVMERSEVIFEMIEPQSKFYISNKERSATVSNNGVFAFTIFTDINSPSHKIKIGDPSRGLFNAFHANAYTGNIYISKNGVYLVIEAGGEFIILNIQGDEVVGRIPLKYYHSEDIEIFEEDKFIYMWYGKDSLVYDFNGNCINEKYKLKILTDAISRGEIGDFKTAYYLFEEKRDDERAQNLIRAISIAVPNVGDVSVSRLSKSCRLIGEYYEGSEPEMALRYYEKALEYNPRAGVKRKMKELQGSVDSKA